MSKGKLKKINIYIYIYMDEIWQGLGGGVFLEPDNVINIYFIILCIIKN